MNNSQRAIFSLWKPTNFDEMWLYITVTLLMGIVNKPQYHMYWTTRHVFATPIFSRLMHRGRYEQLRKMIHFSNPEEEVNTDSLKKLRELIDHLSNVYYENYTPQQNLALDEYLPLWKGRLAFKTYIPSKQERYCIKLYMVCESDTGYLLRFIVYTGGSTVYQEPVEELSKQFDDYTNPSKVVLSLLRGFYNKGYCVTLDNFYTSPEIAKELLSIGTDCYGTLRKKQDLPSDFWQ